MLKDCAESFGVGGFKPEDCGLYVELIVRGPRGVIFLDVLLVLVEDCVDFFGGEGGFFLTLAFCSGLLVGGVVFCEGGQLGGSETLDGVVGCSD